MPTGVAVVDAFKNLIRHGKNHNARHEPSPESSPRSSQQQQQQQQPQKQPQQQSQPRAQQQHHQEQSSAPKQSSTSMPVSQPVEVHTPEERKAAAEAIVSQEREAKSKMPVLKGMENFQLQEKMGDGAFSNVFKAIDMTTNKPVALKVVRKYELSSSQAGDKHLNPQFKKKPRVTERANILKEVQIMRGISHPNVVKLYNFSESHEYYYLVLELMGGGELFHQIVKLTYFSENLSRHVILQVANGIRYLHEERGVVHRDIKPENLLFERIPIIPSKNPMHRPYDEEKEDEGEFIPGVGGGGIGRVKIADFGLSKVVWDEQTMTPCGTVGYTAPEIVKDERYSKSVDMWALGCVLYTLLCGFPPFYDESINVLTEKVARGYYTFLSPWWDDISVLAKDLITHLLCVDPAQRYTIDEFLAHPWCHAAPAPPPPPTPAPTRPLDSPLLSAARGGRTEGRSPGVAALKEAFDVTYAVHRMEEEGARRRKYNGRGGAGARGFLGNLNEEDEDEEQYSAHQPATTSKRTQDASLAAGRAGQRDRGHRKGPSQGGSAKAFSLDLDGATLLERRHKRRAGEGSPLAKGVIAGTPGDMGMTHMSTVREESLPPGSPMHY